MLFHLDAHSGVCKEFQRWTERERILMDQNGYRKMIRNPEKKQRFPSLYCVTILVEIRKTTNSSQFCNNKFAIGWRDISTTTTAVWPVVIVRIQWTLLRRPPRNWRQSTKWCNDYQRFFLFGGAPGELPAIFLNKNMEILLENSSHSSNHQQQQQ